MGAVQGPLALGTNLTVLSFVGVVALSGVVVNNCLILVGFINRFRQAASARAR